MHVPVGKPLFGAIEREYVNDALEKTEISGFSGGYTTTFEKAFAEFCGTKDAVTVSNGTTALHLALAALRIGEGDEVITQSFTNMATFFAILYQNAVPVPVDSEPDTLNIDPALIEAKITPRTKAIMVVHIYGHPVDMDPIMAIAKKHNLFVIEDAAEAHGAEYKGKRVGGIGDIGCFSFYANKIITTGEGGMITTNNPELAKRARSLKGLAFGTQNKFMHEDIGYNYRMTNIQAAFGAAQMTHADELVARKRAIAAYYLEHLAGLPGLTLPVEKPYAKNVYWMFNILLSGPLAGKRAEFMRMLSERGVDTREDFIPCNDQEIFTARGFTKPSDCPIASNAGVNGFYIPSGTDISDEELAYVVEQMKAVVAALQ
jgi:perosamine synthetase